METVAVIFGGRSAEHDVSIITALASIIRPLELTKKYRVEPIYITKDGVWYSDPKLKDINTFSSGQIDGLLNHLKPISLSLENGLKIVKSTSIAGRKAYLKIDLVFPAMHGTYGEDGSLMGLLEMANVPYVGCGLSASAIAMDKLLAKEVAAQNSLDVSNYLSFSKKEIEGDLNSVIDSIVKKLKFPLFVKPVHLGSSIGISRVKTKPELLNGLEVAAHYDDTVLVEEEVQNLIEVTLPIIGNDQPKASLLERPLTKPEDFFDFDTKYLSGGKKSKGPKGAQGYSEIPAKLDKELTNKCLNLGLSIFKAFNLSGIARVDMLIDSKTKKVYFNEVNPLPGSLYAHNFNLNGISNVQLVEELIKLAKERYKFRNSLLTSFNTNYLKQF